MAEENPNTNNSNKSRIIVPFSPGLTLLSPAEIMFFNRITNFLDKNPHGTVEIIVLEGEADPES